MTSFLREGYGRFRKLFRGWLGGRLRLGFGGDYGNSWLRGCLGGASCDGLDGFLLGSGLGIFGLDLFPKGEQFETADFGGLVGIEAQGRFDRLDERLGDGFVAGLALPVIENIGQTANDGGVGVAVAMLEAEEFAQFFEGGLHESILPQKKGTREKRTDSGEEKSR